MDSSQQLAIIGSGIIGLQLARALQRKGLAVTLIDPRAPGTATSYGNAGFIATDEIFPLAHGRVLRSLPRMLLKRRSPLSMRWQEFPRLASWYLRYARACGARQSQRSIKALAALQSKAGDAWKQIAARERVGHLIRESGAWKLFETDRGLRETEAERETQRHYGISWSVMGRDQVLERIPELGPSVRHGVFYANGMSVVNPLTLSEALFDSFVSDGGQFLNRHVQSIEVNPDGNAELLMSDGRLTPGKVVVAAGHLSGRLLKPLGVSVPIVAERGYHLELDCDEVSFDMPVGLHERGFYMTPMTSGLRLAGTSEFSCADHDELPDWQRAEILKSHFGEILPNRAHAELSRWMGHRPTLVDFLPAMGPLAQAGNLYASFGHHHLGLTLSAVSAELMSALIIGDKTDISLTPFALSRFA